MGSSQSSSPPVIKRKDSSFDNDELNEKFKEQKERHARELGDKREERRRKQMEFQREIEKMKEESKSRFRILMACIQMKQKFEEEEHTWKMWTDSCRQNIVKFLNNCNHFVDDVNQNQGGLKRSKKIDNDILRDNIQGLMGNVIVTFTMMQNDYDNLKQLEKNYPDTLFIKVLQKCISDVATKLLEIYKSLEKLEKGKSNIEKLQKKITDLKPNMIPTTSKLRDICKDVKSMKSYKNVEFPSLPKSVIIEEL